MTFKKLDWEFDFKVHTAEHVVSATPGQTIAVAVMIELLRGKPRPVILAVTTNWASVGLIAQIFPSTVIPPGTATLQIMVSPNTPPGSYMFTVQGETSETFKTSPDMVTIVVKPEPKKPEPKKPLSQPEVQATHGKLIIYLMVCVVIAIVIAAGVVWFGGGFGGGGSNYGASCTAADGTTGMYSKSGDCLTCSQGYPSTSWSTGCSNCVDGVYCCGGSSGGAEGYQYWVGSDPNSYYLLDFDGNEATKVTGKPFLVLTYDKISLEITDCEFGFSEVTQEILTETGIYEPTLDANVIDFHEKLGLKSPVVSLASWGASKSIINGVQQFSFIYPNNAIGPGKNAEEFTFVYTSWLMTGGVTNLDTYYFMGRQSETNAFDLVQQ